MGPAGAGPFLMLSLCPQPLQTLLGPEAPAQWLAWPRGSWCWSAPWRRIPPPRLSGTEMASCCRWAPDWGPRDPSFCPAQAQTLTCLHQHLAHLPCCCSPRCYCPHIVDGDPEARLGCGRRASDASRVLPIAALSDTECCVPRASYSASLGSPLKWGAGCWAPKESSPSGGRSHSCMSISPPAPPQWAEPVSQEGPPLGIRPGL